MENAPVHIGHDGRGFTVNGLGLNDPIWITTRGMLSKAQVEKLRAAAANGEIYHRIREEFAREQQRTVTGLQDCTRRALNAVAEDRRRRWWSRVTTWFSDPLSGWRP